MPQGLLSPLFIPLRILAETGAFPVLMGDTAGFLSDCTMKKLSIRPTGPLRGRVDISGSKNAALPILAATLLCEGEVVLYNLPAIRDVETTLQILIHMGCEVERVDAHTCKIKTRHAAMSTCPDPLTGELRGSSYFLGAGLGRFGQGKIGCIGGCDFGTRPIDQHIKAFSALGAETVVNDTDITVTASQLHGACIAFDTVSVGATVNAMLAAVRGVGKTVLIHAAKEPHVVDLANFLICAGADIQGAGTDTICIFGVKTLHGCRYTVTPDMIECGTYLLAAAATQGGVTARGVCPLHLDALLSALQGMGADVDCEEHTIHLLAPAKLHGVRQKTAPYPGFPTDLQPQLVAACAASLGGSVIEECVWGNRFRYVGELHKMGADIRVIDRAVHLMGTTLHGAAMQVPDLRAGAALVIAACAADGESVLYDTEPIERGYEDFIGKMRALGADIQLLD